MVKDEAEPKKVEDEEDEEEKDFSRPKPSSKSPRLQPTGHAETSLRSSQRDADPSGQNTEKSEPARESDREFNSAFGRKRHIGFAAVVVVAFIAGFFVSPAITGNIVASNPNKVANDIVSFINTNLIQGGGMSFVSVSEVSGLYKITGYYNGNQVDFYSTKDGNYFIPPGSMMDTSEPQTQTQATPTNVPKTDKPAVELFVMSHCPYGTQIEKGILPVATLFGDKINFSIKFVYYAMHGKKELDEQLLQHCIQRESNDKYKDYLSCFLEDGDSSRCQSKVGIDQSKLNTCVAETDNQYSVSRLYNDTSTWLSGNFPLFNVYKAENEKYGVGGSPTLIINGQEASSGRDSESLKQAICAAFNTQPAECSQTLSSAQPSPGFGVGTTNSAAAGSCG